MPDHKFAWTNLSQQLLKGLARYLGLNRADPTIALQGKYGARPMEDFVRDARPVLEDKWLAQDHESLTAVVEDLWRRNRDGYRLPSTRQQRLDWLSSRNTTARLCAVMLEQFLATGERTAQGDAVSSNKPDVTARTLGHQIFEIEGLQVRLVPRSGAWPLVMSGGDYPFERAARDNWNVARWRERCFEPNYPDFDVEVLDTEGRAVHGRTLLSTVRATYDQNGPASGSKVPIEEKLVTERGPSPAQASARAEASSHPTRSLPPAGQQTKLAEPASIAADGETPNGQQRRSEPAKQASVSATAEPFGFEHSSGQHLQAPRQRGSTMNEANIKNHAAFIWSVADLLRGDYKQSEYGKVILPLTVIRRLDCVLEPTKPRCSTGTSSCRARIENIEPVLQAVAGRAVLQHQPARLHASCSTTRPRSPATCELYIGGFSAAARDVIDKFDFDVQIDRLRQGQPALPGDRQVRRHRPAPRRRSRTSRWATSTRS